VSTKLKSSIEFLKVIESAVCLSLLNTVR
jgi:hypothetical protein